MKPAGHSGRGRLVEKRLGAAEGGGGGGLMGLGLWN